MVVYRPEIPPHVAEIIRHLPPDLKRSTKQSIRRLSFSPHDGAPLLRELAGRGNIKYDVSASSMKQPLKLGHFLSSR